MPYEQTNRYARSRVLAELRNLPTDADNPPTIGLAELGSRVRASLADEELPWLYDVANGLEKDGLAAIEEEPEQYDAGPVEALVRVRVRLP